jgi:hypothetical protein
MAAAKKLTPAQQGALTRKPARRQRGGGNAQATGECSQSSSDTGKEQSLKVTPPVAHNRGVPDHQQG